MSMAMILPRMFPPRPPEMGSDRLWTINTMSWIGIAIKSGAFEFLISGTKSVEFFPVYFVQSVHIFLPGDKYNFWIDNSF